MVGSWKAESRTPDGRGSDQAFRAAQSLLAFWREAGAGECSALERILAAGPQDFRRHLNRASPERRPSPRPPAAPASRRAVPPRVPAGPHAAPAAFSAGGAHAAVQARLAAGSAEDWAGLAAQAAAFDDCPLKRTARRTVFFDGPAEPAILWIGGAPDREDDESGRPFSGRAGQLLEAMARAVGLEREREIMCGYSVFWRPPGDRDPNPHEIETCRPFVRRAIELAKPALVVVAGSIAAQAVLRRSETIARIRGKKFAYPVEKPGDQRPGDQRSGDQLLVDPAADARTAPPVWVMLEPRLLLRRPQDKGRVWADLQALARDLAECRRA